MYRLLSFQKNRLLIARSIWQSKRLLSSVRRDCIPRAHTHARVIYIQTQWWLRSTLIYGNLDTRRNSLIVQS